MDFKSIVVEGVKKDLNPHEGACGICHLTLKNISEAGGQAISYEVPGGTIAQIIDDNREVIGEGVDLVWAPSILAAEIDAGLLPEPAAKSLKKLLTNSKDRKSVSDIFGYGRCVTPAAKAISIVWQDGGRVVIARKGLGIGASLYNRYGELISEAVTGFCPICAVNISISRNKDLKERVTNELEGMNNTGLFKYEQGITNRVEWKNRRVYSYILKGNEIIGMNWGCCIAYATVRAEIAAGFGNRKWNLLFKNYCDFCPLKHCWTGKTMGALGNVILERMQNIGVEERLKIENYLTAHILKDKTRIAEGIGTLCSLSATVNAFLRADAVEILKPSPARGFPYKDKDRTD
ncbi:MAG: hypothetical protein HVN35_08390 [Methanobacteriaceae archaeon]|nr:hypothetical protein [Methanobacteriaceae archaeon]